VQDGGADGGADDGGADGGADEGAEGLIDDPADVAEDDPTT
jgi:hypothetical protein